MRFEPPGSTAIEGELTAETNGVVSTLSGSGSLLQWNLVDAAVVLAGRPRTGRKMVKRVADALASAGVTMLVHENGRPLLEAGRISSRVGWLVFGTRNARPRSPLRLLALAYKLR